MANEQRRKIVCIEDEPDMIDLIKLILERQNFEVIGALGGREGIETIRREKPDLVCGRLGSISPDPRGLQTEEYSDHRGYRQGTKHRQSPGITHCQSRRLRDQAVWPSRAFMERRKSAPEQGTE
jgi:hypothetical protein